MDYSNINYARKIIVAPLSTQLTGAFNFKDMPEGAEYWAEVVYKLRAIEEQNK